MLKVTMILLLSACAQSKVDVIIVGAGVSGTTAARTLADAGLKVKVFESRDRKGGRVFSDSTAFGYPIDFGAAWIHGKDGNQVYTNAIANGVSLFSFDFDDSKYYSNTIKFGEDEDPNDKYYKIGKEFKKFVQDYAKKLPEDKDVTLAFIYPLFVKTLPEKNKSESLEYLENYIAWDLEGDFASVIEVMSAKEYDIRARKGGDYLVPAGYWTVFEKASLHANIEYVLNSKVVEVNQLENTPFIVLENGSKHEADYILVTVPLGVLKKNIISFKPPLSEDKQKAIKTLGFGNLEKVVVQFTKVFWDDASILKILESPFKSLSYIANLNKVAGKPTLIFLVAGGTKYFKDFYTATEDDMKSQVIKTLTPYFPLNTEIKIAKIKWTKWLEDVHAFGSYSSYSVGSSSDSVRDIEKKFKKVYFAGEHTSVTDLETVAGAFKSGLREAKKILTAKKNKKDL